MLFIINKITWQNCQAKMKERKIMKNIILNANPVFNTDGAKNLVLGYWNTFQPFLYFLIPIITAAWCLNLYIQHATKEPDEQEQRPLLPRFKKAIFWGLFALSLNTILEIVGL